MNNSGAMITENKYRWMIWAIVVLAVMNITTLITILIQGSNSRENSAPVLSEKQRSEDPSVEFSGRYFRDQLNLNGEQMAEFAKFNPEFRNNVRKINISLAKMRQQMIMEMAAEKSDTAKLNMLSDSIGYLHANLKKLTYGYYLDFKRICDKEQQARLEMLFGGMFAPDFQMGGQHRQRNRFGRGYGRRSGN